MTGLSADINQLREENPPAKLRAVVENTDVRGTIELQVTAGVLRRGTLVMCSNITATTSPRKQLLLLLLLLK